MNTTQPEKIFTLSKKCCNECKQNVFLGFSEHFQLRIFFFSKPLPKKSNFDIKVTGEGPQEEEERWKETSDQSQTLS
jgi:hypothetical protein